MFTLGELAARTGGKVDGDEATTIRRVRPFSEAESGDITLAVGKSFEKRLHETGASAVIVRPGIAGPELNLLVTPFPKLAFARILQFFSESPFRSTGISPFAFIGQRVQVEAEQVSIGPFVYVGDDSVIEDEVTLGSGASIGMGCRVGKGSVLHPNVTLYPGVEVGRRVILHAGVVIGADGFGYVPDGDRQIKMPQTGNVVIGDDVEIGANSCVDRATFGSTVVENGVKLDNLIQVGHNCRIGENTIVVGCVGISGSVTIGKNCVLAGQSGVVDHVTLGDRSVVMMKTAVSRDVPEGGCVSGLYGRDHREELRIQAALRQLPDLVREWRRVRRQTKEA